MVAALRFKPGPLSPEAVLLPTTCSIGIQHTHMSESKLHHDSTQVVYIHAHPHTFACAYILFCIPPLHEKKIRKAVDSSTYKNSPTTKADGQHLAKLAAGCHSS